MSGDTKPGSLVERFWMACWKIFGSVVLLALAVELFKQIWIPIVLTVVALTIVAVVVVLVRLWWRRRHDW